MLKLKLDGWRLVEAVEATEAWKTFSSLEAVKAAMSAYAKEFRCLIITKRTRKGERVDVVRSIEFGCSGNCGKRGVARTEDECCLF